MTIQQRIDEEEAAQLPATLVARMAWITKAMRASRRLLAALQRRSRLPGAIPIRLITLANIGQSLPYSPFSHPDLTWYRPGRTSLVTTPIKIYLSEEYHLLGRGALRQASLKAEHFTLPAFKTIVPLRAERGPITPKAQLDPRDFRNGHVAGHGLVPLMKMSPPQRALTSLGPKAPNFTASHKEKLARPVVDATPSFRAHRAASMPDTQSGSLIFRRRNAAEHDSLDGYRIKGLRNAKPHSRPVPGRSPVRESTPPANLVDTLFDHAMQQSALPEFALRMVPDSVAPHSRDTALDSVHSRVMQQRLNTQQAAPLSVLLSRSEVAMIAEQVTHVLNQQQRHERERQGRY